MPVLDARALDDDPEGIAILRGVLEAGKPDRRARQERLPTVDVHEPQRRRRMRRAKPLAGECAPQGRLATLAMGS